MTEQQIDEHLLITSANQASNILEISHRNSDAGIIQIYMLLHSLLGGDAMMMQHWMKTPNKHLDNEIPSELIKTKEGEDKVISILFSYNNESF